MSIDMAKLGGRIRDIRKSKKLTTSELANKVGVSRDVISNIENGRSEPVLPDFIKIMQILDTDADSIFYDFIFMDRNYVENKLFKNIKEIARISPKMVSKMQDLLRLVCE